MYGLRIVISKYIVIELLIANGRSVTRLSRK